MTVPANYGTEYSLGGLSNICENGGGGEGGSIHPLKKLWRIVCNLFKWL